MFRIQQLKSSICRAVLLTVLLEFTFVDKSFSNQKTFVDRRISNQKTCGFRNTGSISYFKLGDETMNWDEAWNLCNNNSATLPVICNKHEQDALTTFLHDNIGSSATWTSGEKIPFDRWTWVDRQPFNNRDVIGGQHESHTHVAINMDGSYKAQHPNSKTYYLCQYSGSLCNSDDKRVTNGCVRPSDDDRSWYDARNQCLRNGGDLAILKDADLGILRNLSTSRINDKVISIGSYWIGLRNITWRWIWQGTVPSDGSGEEIEYTKWSNEPHSTSYECISIDASNGEWKSVRCTDKKKIICQRNHTSSSTTSRSTTRTLSSTTSRTTTRTLPSTTSRTTTRTLSSTTTSTVSRMSSSRTTSTTGMSRMPSKPTSSISESMTQIMTEEHSNRSTESHVLVYSGAGAGIVIIVVCIIVVILAVRYTRKSPKKMDQSKGENNSEQNRRNESANKPATTLATSSTSAPAYVPVAEADDSRGLYAEISLATLNHMEDEAKPEQPGVVYAALEFQKEPTYLEPDKKRAHTTDATKVAPMGDIIYAMPHAKGHAVTSPGNESASHPTKVTPQGDVYALPVNHSKSPTANPSGGGIYENL